MRAIISVLNLQETIKKIRCNGLLNSGVIEFKDGNIQAKGNGVEATATSKKGENATKTASKVDGSMSFEVHIPTPVQEAGEIAISNLQDLLSKTEIFEKEDLISVSTENNKLIMSRELPVMVLEYDLADRKFIPSAHKDQQDVIFGYVPTGSDPANTIPMIVLKNLKGVTKEFPFTTEIIMDASQLKAFASVAGKISVTRVPLQVKDGKFISALKGSGSSAKAEIKTDKTIGEASATYGAEIIELFNMGFGLATLRFATDSMIHIHYELNQQKADYLTVPAAKSK